MYLVVRCVLAGVAQGLVQAAVYNKFLYFLHGRSHMNQSTVVTSAALKVTAASCQPFRTGLLTSLKCGWGEASEFDSG
jgi:hypothetical protein